MTTKAHIKDEWERGMVGIAVIRDFDRGRREIIQWPTLAVQVRDAHEGYREEAEEDRLHLREEDARAIYEALAEHFGHAGHDIRSLRKDYDAERGRVDKLLAHLTREP